NGVVNFGLWLPWVSAADGNAVTVKVIHEDDQFLQDLPPREFALTHSVRSPYGDFWSGTVPVTGTTPAVAGSAWGSPGRYVYRYTIRNPNVGTLDWIIDPLPASSGSASSRPLRSATSRTCGAPPKRNGARQHSRT